MSSKYNDEGLVMHSKSDNIAIMINDKEEKVTEELFESLLNRYQIGLETSVRGSDFIFDYIHVLYYKCHKINSNRRGSYVVSPDWIKNKKSNNKPHQQKRYKMLSICCNSRVMKK